MIKQQYWLITYSWVEGENERVMEHAVHHGAIWQWVDMAIDQPDRWVLHNQVEIEKDHYLNLLERI